MSNTPLPERKMAPVQGWPQGIPWSLHLEAYSAYCKKWSPQPALIEGWCRGGFGTKELDEFIPGWRERASEIAQLRSELDHAAAVSAAKDAEIAGLREYIEAAKAVGIRQESIIMDRDARIKVLEDALTKIDAIRNDIIGRQKIGWSSHVYPLVAALDEAGYPGLDYDAARAALGDKTPNE